LALRVAVASGEVRWGWLPNRLPACVPGFRSMRLIRSLWTRPAAQWPGAGRVPRLPVIACSSDPSGTGREVASRHAPRADTTGGYASLIPPAEADRGAPRSALSWSPNLAKPCPAGGRQPFKHGRSVLLRHSDPGAGPGRQRAERGRGERDDGGQPQPGQPAAGGAFRVAERARGW